MQLIATILFLVSLPFGNIIRIGIGDASLYFHDIALSLLVIAFSLQQYRKGTRAIPRLAWYVVGFAAIAICSLVLNARRFTSLESGQSLLYLVRWLLYASLYWVTAFSQYPSLWIAGLYVAGVVVAVLGFLQLWLYPDLRNLYYLGWDPHYQRLFSTLLDPNFVGIVLVLTFLLGFVVYQGISNKKAVLLGQIICVCALALTYSRGSFLAFAVGAGIMLGYKKHMRRWIPLAMILFAVAAVFLSGAGEGRNLLRITSTNARIGNWLQSAELVRGSPIVGYGFNTLRFVQEQKVYVPETGVPSHSAAGIDNSILFLLATTGVVGAIWYMWLLYRMASIAKTRVFSAALTAILVHSMFVNSLFYPWVMIWIWIVAGLIEGNHLLRQKSAAA